MGSIGSGTEFSSAQSASTALAVCSLDCNVSSLDWLALQLIRTLMDEAAQANLTVMRAWAVGVTSNYAIQTSPGVFNEAMFRGIDYALDQARQHNIKVGTSP